MVQAEQYSRKLLIEIKELRRRRETSSINEGTDYASNASVMESQTGGESEPIVRISKEKGLLEKQLNRDAIQHTFSKNK